MSPSAKSIKQEGLPIQTLSEVGYSLFTTTSSDQIQITCSGWIQLLTGVLLTTTALLTPLRGFNCRGRNCWISFRTKSNAPYKVSFTQRPQTPPQQVVLSQ